MADALIDFFRPPLRLVAGVSNVVRRRAPAVWLALSGVAVLVMAAGFVVVLMPVPPAAKLAPAVFLASAIGTSLTAHTENRRFGAPIVPLVMMAGVTALHRMRRPVAQRNEPAAPRKRAVSANGAGGENAR